MWTGLFIIRRVKIIFSQSRGVREAIPLYFILRALRLCEIIKYKTTNYISAKALH